MIYLVDTTNNYILARDEDTRWGCNPEQMLIRKAYEAAKNDDAQELFDLVDPVDVTATRIYETK